MGASRPLRSVRCFCFSLEDVYIALSLIMGLAVLTLALVVAVGAAGGSTWSRIYAAVFLGVDSALCFLNAVPGWRLKPISPNVLGGFSFLSYGQAVGFGLSNLWINGVKFDLPPIFDYLAAFLLGFPTIVNTTEPPSPVNEVGVTVNDTTLSQRQLFFELDIPFIEDLPTYVAIIIAFTCTGLALSILSFIHEFILKPSKYPRRYFCRYVFFALLVGFSAAWNLALGVIAVNPDLPLHSVIGGHELSRAAVHTLPRALMAGLWYGAAAFLLLLFWRRWQKNCGSKFVLILLSLGQSTFIVLSFVDFHLTGAWEEFPNSLIGILFSTSLFALILSKIALGCCAPPKIYENRVPVPVLIPPVDSSSQTTSSSTYRWPDTSSVYV